MGTEAAGDGTNTTSPVRADSVSSGTRATDERIVLSHFCIRHATFAERVAAASAAGLTEIGLLYRAYDTMRAEGIGPKELQAVLARHGVWVSELEVLRPWATDDRGRAMAAAAEATLFEMAEVFSARYIQVIGPYTGDFDEATEVFAGLCDRAASVGLVVGIEFLPFTNIPDAGVALELVTRAGRPNAGVCIDSWHHVRGANDWSLLEALPGDKIVAVQLNDGTLAPENPDYLADCLSNRRPPGRGEFDLARLVALLRSKGVAAPLSVEVISDELDRLEPKDAVREIVTATRTLLERPAR